MPPMTSPLGVQAGRLPTMISSIIWPSPGHVKAMSAKEKRSPPGTRHSRSHSNSYDRLGLTMSMKGVARHHGDAKSCVFSRLPTASKIVSYSAVSSSTYQTRPPPLSAMNFFSKPIPHAP